MTERYVKIGEELCGWIIGDDDRGWQAFLYDGEILDDLRQPWLGNRLFLDEWAAHGEVVARYRERKDVCTLEMQAEAQRVAQFLGGTVERDDTHGKSFASFSVKNKHGDLAVGYIRTGPFEYDEHRTVFAPPRVFFRESEL